MLLQGLFVPLTCPFQRDGASYVRKLEHNVRRYSLGPAAGLIALPPKGEALALTDAETRESLHAIAEAAAPEKVLVAGVQRASCAAALELAEAAAQAGFDAILLAPPTAWQSVGDEAARDLRLYLQVVADASPLPVILSSDGAPGSLKLPVGVVAALARHPNVISLADAALSVERLEEILAATAVVKREVMVTTVFESVTRRMLGAAPGAGAAAQGFVAIESLSGVSGVAARPALPALKTRTRSVGFQVLSAGPAHHALALLRAGATGVAPQLAACAPQGCFEAYAAWKDGDEALAAERAARLQAADTLLSELGPAGVKYGCDWNAYFGGNPRLPKLPLIAEQRAAVEGALGDVRN